jgi:hypothetical protein
MATPGAKSASASARRRFAWRPLLRNLHRDAGYLVVGFTLIYAVSGLAVNHIGSANWDPNFTSYRAERQVPVPLPAADQAAAAQVLTALELRGPARSIYRASPSRLEIELDRRRLHVNTATGRVLEEGQKPRLLLRAANWLHLNRGKRAWTIAADAYAVLLLFLAISGLFMLPGRKGVLGRGGLLVLAGIAVPVLYVALSGGP